VRRRADACVDASRSFGPPTVFSALRAPARRRLGRWGEAGRALNRSPPGSSAEAQERCSQGRGGERGAGRQRRVACACLTASRSRGRTTSPTRATAAGSMRCAHARRPSSCRSVCKSPSPCPGRRHRRRRLSRRGPHAGRAGWAVPPNPSAPPSPPTPPGPSGLSRRPGWLRWTHRADCLHGSSPSSRRHSTRKKHTDRRSSRFNCCPLSCSPVAPVPPTLSLARLRLAAQPDIGTSHPWPGPRCFFVASPLPSDRSSWPGAARRKIPALITPARLRGSVCQFCQTPARPLALSITLALLSCPPAPRPKETPPAHSPPVLIPPLQHHVCQIDPRGRRQGHPQLPPHSCPRH